MLGGDFHEVDALVDTGASHTVMPDEFLRNLRIETPYVCHVSTEGGAMQEWLMGVANISYYGRMAPCQVLASPGHDEYLLGATTLEALGFMVDPIDQVLIPTVART